MEFNVKNRIEKVCEELELSRAQLGIILGVTESTISRWASGKTRPNRNEEDLINALLKLIDIAKQDEQANATLMFITATVGKTHREKWVIPVAIAMFPLLGFGGLIAAAVYESLKNRKAS